MDASKKRLLLACGATMILFVLWQQYLLWRYGKKPVPTQVVSSQPVSSRPASDGALVEAPGADTPPATQVATSQNAASAKKGIVVLGGDSRETIELGSPEFVADASEDAYWLHLVLTSRGASIEQADITRFRKTVKRRKSDPDQTYDLLNPVKAPDDGVTLYSMTTESVRLIKEIRDNEPESGMIRLGDLDWNVSRDQPTADTQRATFTATVDRDGKPYLAITKTYQISRGSFDVAMKVDIRNLTDAPVALSLYQGGPSGVRSEDPRFPDCMVLVGTIDGESMDVASHPRQEVARATDRRVDLLAGKEVRWVAQANKWFASIIHPAEAAAGIPSLSLKRAFAYSRSDSKDRHLDTDLHSTLVMGMDGEVGANGELGKDGELAPGATVSAAFDIFMGPKDRTLFTDEALPYATLGYEQIIDKTTQSCSYMSFDWLRQLMRWLLLKINSVFDAILPGAQHYGLAIIVLVLLVRTGLHPITKRGQINMMRMQKNMAKVQPKIESLRLRYKDDPQALNQAMFKLYKDEGINPVGQMLPGCLPMFIQMPVWVALWATLNSSFELRHQPFILWIRDLSAPDALIQFSGEYNIPLLSIITGPISALNVLPIMMAMAMYAQQKLTQKLTRPDKPVTAPEPSADGKPSPADQVAQQQKMMGFMTVFFGFMFYNFPSGLNLYIFTSNIFGMIEQWRIRTHIKESEINGDDAGGNKGGGKKSLKRPAWLERLEKIAEDAKRS